MNFSVGNITRLHVTLVLLVVFVGGGYAYYSQMYTPAKEKLAASKTSLQSAEQALAAKQLELQDIAVKGSDKSGLAKVIVTNAAIPPREMKVESMIQISRLAKLSGVTIISHGVDAQATSQTGSVRGMDYSVTGTGKYSNMVTFLDRVQKMVSARQGKVYVKGRLMNVKSVEVGTEVQSGGNEVTELPPGHVSVNLVIQVFTTAPAGGAAASAAAAAATATPAPTTAPAPGGAAAPAPAPGSEGSATTTPATPEGVPAGTS